MTLSIRNVLAFLTTNLHHDAHSPGRIHTQAAVKSRYRKHHFAAIKGLLILFVLSCYISGLSQSDTSAVNLFRRATRMIPTNRDRAYDNLVTAMRLSKKNNQPDVYVNIVNSLARIAFTGKKDTQLKEVFVWVKEAVETSKPAKEDTSIAQLHYNAAEFYNANYEIERPVWHYQKAIKIWSSLSGELNKEVAKCYHGLGDVYKYYKFDFILAEKCYEKALSIREKIGFKNTGILYLNYYSLAATNRSQHDFEKAISYGHKTLDLAAQLKKIKTMEMSNGMVANIYRDMGETELAKQYYNNALVINKKTKNMSNRAWYHLSIGELLRSEGKLLKRASLLDEALLNFKISHKIYTQYFDGDRLLFIELLLKMADTYALKHDEYNFRKIIQETFSVLASIDKLKGKQAYFVHLLLGDYHNEKNNLDSALYHYQKAFAAAIPSFNSLRPENNPSEKSIGLNYFIYEGLAKKASVLKSKFRITKNADYLKRSIACLIEAERLVTLERNTLDMEASKWQFLDANYDIYEDILSNLYEGINVLPKDTVYNLAFHYFEQSKARSLADALTLTEQSKQISSEDSLFRLNAELKRMLFNAQDKLAQELEKPRPAPDTVGKLRNEIVLLDRRIQVCRYEIEARYPGYFNIKYGYQPPALHAIQSSMRNDRAFIEYFWGSNAVYAIGLNNHQTFFKRVGIPDSIKADINAVLVHLQSAELSKDGFKIFTSNARRLYKTLIAPFDILLAEKHHLQIVPDGSISQLPFEILLAEDVTDINANYYSAHYLIREFAIGYAYSSAMMTIERRPIRKPSLLAVGFTGGQSLRTGQELAEIEGAELELEALGKRFGSGKFVTGHDATESNFKKLAPNYDIIHLAIHGNGDVQKNFSAKLYFGSKYDSVDDGDLHAYELYGLKLKAVMAVLTSCESGLGKGYKGEGMISMASAFTYSGCQNILMSLWKVNDQASTILMDDFYSQLLAGETIDDALRIAKLNYLQKADELTADPKIWAPLVAYGSLNNVFKKDESNVYYIVAGVFLILIVVILLRFRKLIL